MKLYYRFILLLLVLQGHSCEEGSKKSCSLVFHHRFGDEKFALYQKYMTLHQEQVSFTRLQYYISNIQLWTEEGEVWQEKDSYHLVVIDSLPDFEILLKDVPLKNYSKIQFSIGIDSLRNHSGRQEKDLDPLKGMFWTWSQGYIFFKTEGYYYTNNQKKGGFTYHIGDNINYRIVTLPVKKASIQNKRNQLSFDIVSDLQKLFGGFPKSAIDLKIPVKKVSMSVMGGEKSSKVADNYIQMFYMKEHD